MICLAPRLSSLHCLQDSFLSRCFSQGGLPTLRHNEIRDVDLTATLFLIEVCYQVQVEPEFQPVSSPETFSLLTTNTQNGARLDIVMNGFWEGRSEHCCVDDRVFNPYVSSIVFSLPASFKQHENMKHRVYGQRI